MFKKLRNRFLILNMVIISVVMLSAFAVIYGTVYGNLRKENQAKLQSESALWSIYGKETVRDADWDLAVEGIIGGGTRITYVEEVVYLPSDYSLSFSVALDEVGGIAKAHSFLDFSPETYGQAAELAASGKDYATITLEGRKWMHMTTDTNGWTQITFLDVSDTSAAMSELLFTMLAVGLGMLFVIFAVSRYFANRAILPISEAWEKQKRFTADASHELKTPLAIISANADAIAGSPDATVESQKKWLDYIRAQTERMSELVGGLLYLAKTEDSPDAALLPVDVSELVSESVMSMEAPLYEKGLTLSQSVEPDIVIDSDGGRLRRVVMILLDNAVKYTPEGGHVDVALKREQRHMRFEVRNSGGGLTVPERLFDRFYRADEARTFDGSSFGLGLSIARAAIDSLGGRVWAESSDGQAAFIFTLGL